MVINMNTPTLITDRLILRKFSRDDLGALFRIFSDAEVNTFLPLFPLKSMEEAEQLFETRYDAEYRHPTAYKYAICLRTDNMPIGYINVSMDESHDIGYGMMKEFRQQGFVSEAARAVIARVKEDGIPYITATHDVNNPRSGYVMRAAGMRYMYSYEEMWQPKNFPVIFRMYQMNLDGNETRVFRKYWDMYERHFVEDL